MTGFLWGEHVWRTLGGFALAVWLLWFTYRRWWWRRRLSLRERREMQESIQQFNRRDRYGRGPWR